MNIAQINNVILVSHEKLINDFYKCTKHCGSIAGYILNKKYFGIYQPFKSKLSRRRCRILEITDETLKVCKWHDLIKEVLPVHLNNDNKLNIIVENPSTLNADLPNYTSIGELKGGNCSDQSIVAEVNKEFYLIPPNCHFYNFDVSEILKHLTEKYNLIVLDPPWWNKYIRRKRSKAASECYDMMWNEEFADIPIDTLLEENGLVAVWCTNSITHINALKDIIFPRWKVKFVAEWFWLKVTLNGEVVTPFSPINGKQPFERILFGVKNENRSYPSPPSDTMIASVPSIIHSHKPPLCDLLKHFVSPQLKGLEIFARNLLPGWTSYGNEVLRLQHISLFTKEYKGS